MDWASGGSNKETEIDDVHSRIIDMLPLRCSGHRPIGGAPGSSPLVTRLKLHFVPNEVRFVPPASLHREFCPADSSLLEHET